MFGFFARARRTQKKATDWPRLRFEQLEARDCPTALAIPTFSAQAIAGHQVVLTGTVTGDNAAGAVVNFSGAVTGSVMADANGNYSFTANAAALGVVNAVAVDSQLHSSSAVSTTITVSAPTITLAVTSINASVATLSGTVTDLDGGGDTVFISGALTGKVTTDVNGNFTFTLATSALGTVYVSTIDLWGNLSNTAEVAASSFPPVIVAFTATQSSGNTWVFQGTVECTEMQGLVVTLGGLPQLVGQTVTVAANGNFYFVQILGINESGTATAQATDQSGEVSNIALAIVS
jgi:hypothetical protein